MLTNHHKVNAMKMNNWSIVARNPYACPPEAQIMCLSGIVGNHPYLHEQNITTSSVIVIDGRYCLTYSGSVYLLEKVSEEYASFVKQNLDQEVYDRLFSETPIRINKENPSSYPELAKDAFHNFMNRYPLESQKDI